MFVTQTHVASMYRVVATLVTLSVLLWNIGAWATAEAANVMEFTDLLSDSAPGVGSNHTISFRSPTQDIDGAETITLTFPDGATDFDLSTIGQEDIDLLIDGVNEAAANWSVSTTTFTIVLTMAGASIPSTSTSTILIGTHATNEGSPDSQIINPSGSNQSYELTVQGPSDTGATRVAIVDTVTVTASVATEFDFVVTGWATSTPVNGTSTTRNASATLIPFGELVANEIETIAQRLQVTTNARNGFVVTVEQDGNLRSATGADIDGFDDGSYNDDPSIAAGNWSAPGENITLENTWGHWGLSSMDDLNSSEFQTCPQAATGGCWVAASTTPREIFTHDGPADGLTNSSGSTTVSYQVEISPLQEAADDYSTTLTYIATPTF